jgi:siroheme synthase
MALRRIGAIATELIAAGRAPDEPVALISEATTPRQRCRLATLATIDAVAALVPHDAPTLIVIGPTVALHRVLAAWQQSAPATLPTPADPALAAGAVP